MLHVISDGRWKLDAGSLFGETPKAVWENWGVATDRKNRVTLGINCLLVDTPAEKVLVNTGIGSVLLDNQRFAHPGLVPSRLLSGLKAHGVAPREIDKVILSDLRFVNAGGCIRFNRAGNIIPVFPRAEYIVQRDAVREALSPYARRSYWYPGATDIVSTLAARGQMSTIDGDREILPGMAVEETGSFSRGHQIVLVRDGGENAVYLGSLVPTLHHLGECVPAFARDAETTARRKEEILAKAVRGGWLLVFPWEAKTPACYVQEVRDPEGSRKTFKFVSVDLGVARQPALVG